MKIKKHNDNLIVTIPIKQLVGVIDGYEQGFCQNIDMSYKGKDPQVGGGILHTDLDNDEFHKLCNDLRIKFIQYDTCVICGKTIYGTFTLNSAGEYCHIECGERDPRNPINQNKENKSNIDDLVELSKEENSNKTNLLEDAYERGVNEGKKIAKDILYEAIKEVFNK